MPTKAGKYVLTSHCLDQFIDRIAVGMRRGAAAKLARDLVRGAHVEQHHKRELLRVGSIVLVSPDDAVQNNRRVIVTCYRDN